MSPPPPPPPLLVSGFRAAFDGSLLNKITLSFMYMYVAGLTVCDFVICIYGSR